MGGWLLDNETRPGQSSAAQVQDAGLVRILCVAREGAYETLHEPPTADPHGGWCGGWGLEASGYPISPLATQSYWSLFRGDSRRWLRTSQLSVSTVDCRNLRPIEARKTRLLKSRP